MPPPHEIPPWERFREAGPLSAFIGTLWSVLRSPALFFSRLRADGPVRPALLFWIVTTLPPFVVSGIEGYSFMQETIDILMTAPRPGVFEIPWWIFVVVAPLVQFASLLSGLAMVHLVLTLLGYARGGWRGTWRAGGYASAPAVFGYLPLVGVLVAGIWTAVLQYMALKRVHAAPTWAVLLAYLIPVAGIMAIGIGLVLIVIAVVAPAFLGLPG